MEVKAMVGLDVLSGNVKRNTVMVGNRLATLDGSTIAVELLHDGQRKLLRGIATYAKDPMLGRVLKVNVREDWGEMDFVLREGEWDGEIALGTANGCDYQICLSSSCVCTR